MGSYQMADVTLNGKSWSKQWRWTAGIKNIFDVKNIQSQLVGGSGGHSGATSSSPVGTGRTFFVSSVFELGNQLRKGFSRT
jgi:outer membrane receptor protein involved in Fe transport